MWLSPPRGMDIDQTKLTREDVGNAFTNTNFPRIYVNLCVGKDRQRWIPQLNSGQILTKDCDFNITVKFNNTGSTDNATYIFLLCYTDYNLSLDLKTRKFAPFYNLK